MRKMVPAVTRYGDGLFRSRLEARWAAFFDLAGVQWEYEPDKEYGKGWWPDFRLADVEILDKRREVLVEVKPAAFDPIMIDPQFNKAIGPDWVLLLGLGPSRGFLGFVARRHGGALQTIGITHDAERGLYGAPLNTPAAATVSDFWSRANSIVTPAGVSQAINKGIEAKMGKKLFHFRRNA